LDEEKEDEVVVDPEVLVQLLLLLLVFSKETGLNEVTAVKVDSPGSWRDEG
jgi:hypothetical protein